MPDPRFPFLRPDDLISSMTADQYNARNEEIERRGRLAASGGWRFSEGPGGRSLSMARPDAFWAKLSGSANPYAFAQVAQQGDGTWLPVDGGYSGDGTPGGVRAYEVNAVANLNNKVAWLTPGYPGDYRFQHVAAGNGGGGPIIIPIPGCFCTSLPASGISLTPAFGNDPFGNPTNSATYGNAYQPCAMAYYDGLTYGYPPYGNSFAASFPGPGFYSTTTWIDDSGYVDYLWLTCFGTQFSLSLGQYAGGTWFSPGRVFIWAIGSKTAPYNVCNPFLLSIGQSSPGTFFYGQFIVSG